MAKDKLDLVIDRIEDLKESTEKRLDHYNASLDAHMEQTMLVREQNAEIRAQNIEIVKQTEMLTKLHKDNEVKIEQTKKEIQELKEPKIAMKVLKSTILYLGAICGGALAIIKLLDELP